MGYQDTLYGKPRSAFAYEILTLKKTQNEQTPYRYNNTIHAFATIAREEGFRGFYKGLGPSLIGVSHVAVQFPLYEKLKVIFRKFCL